MVRLIVLILVGLLFFGGLYMVVFKRGDVNKTLGGYKKAATPQEAADMFKKAITDRDYAIAADYCTKDYAEQLKRGNDAARASEENAKNPSLARRTNGLSNSFACDICDLGTFKSHAKQRFVSPTRQRGKREKIPR